jgi:galactokinase/mevalonate kinase-like predicted kinase
MKKLLSLPPNLVQQFHAITETSDDEYFCVCDPEGHRIGSAGGTAWLINQSWKQETRGDVPFMKWLSSENRIIMHAGGRSRRSPAYAPLGKILTPVPVFRWERGQKLNQTIMDLLLPLFGEIMEHSTDRQHILIGNGDAYFMANEPVHDLPDADIVCYGMWVNKDLASNHGVFICNRNHPSLLKYMLQKPSIEQLNKEEIENLFLMDIGIWVLSDRAIKILMEKCNCLGQADRVPDFYDLYGQFGMFLGESPSQADSALNGLSVAVVPVRKGDFYHFGTSPELISSALSIQNSVMDQREILHKNSKIHPSIFIQNAQVDFPMQKEHVNIWIENSYLSKGWFFAHDHIFTGIPLNHWTLNIPDGICIDMVPVGEKAYGLRLYAMNDPFQGSWKDESTIWLAQSFYDWLEERGLNGEELFNDCPDDLQSLPIFPLIENLDDVPDLISWILNPLSLDPEKAEKEKQFWLTTFRLSADELSDQANLVRLYQQRIHLMRQGLPVLRRNANNSIFYQINLNHVAQEWVKAGFEKNTDTETTISPYQRMQEWMFRAKVLELTGSPYKQEEENAFGLLREEMIQLALSSPVFPKLSVLPDQIMWGRSPVRIDFAGGWTDTPPYCLVRGGKVVNMAINLNGQPPIQVFIKRSDKPEIILRSIDLGTHEVIRDWKNLGDYQRVGSEFSISKVALCLCGFMPDFCCRKFNSLEEQLKQFGGGIDISTLAAIPKGSGLGTSSVLSATVLGTLAEFCGMNWEKSDICQKTIILEQMLTTGGGWQDQYGGILPGVKLLESESGLVQTIQTRWAPDSMFVDQVYKNRMLLYYTGITRTAKNILSEIVKGMFLNNSEHLTILKRLEQNALSTFDGIQCGDIKRLINGINQYWILKQAIDAGSNPPALKAIIDKFKDLSSAYLAPGAGGGGYLFIIAKDTESAGIIKERLTDNPPNDRARFVDLAISNDGLQITRS